MREFPSRVLRKAVHVVHIVQVPLRAQRHLELVLCPFANLRVRIGEARLELFEERLVYVCVCVF